MHLCGVDNSMPRVYFALEFFSIVNPTRCTIFRVLLTKPEGKEAIGETKT